MTSANLLGQSDLVQVRLGGLDYPTMNVYFGSRVKAAREAIGMTQPELADLVRKRGISVAEGEISRIERGAVKNPALQKVVAIAMALGATTDELLSPMGEDGPETSAAAGDEVTEARRRRALEGLAAAWEREAEEERDPPSESDGIADPSGR